MYECMYICMCVYMYLGYVQGSYRPPKISLSACAGLSYVCTNPVCIGMQGMCVCTVCTSVCNVSMNT